MACLKKILSITVLSISFFVLSTAFSLAATAPCDTSSFCQGSSCTSSINLTFPPGGGTISNKAYVTLPGGAYISSASMELTASGITGQTPFIWLPLSTQSKIIQLRTADGSTVRVFGAADGCAFNNPSRFTVIAGGDVWVANRGAGSVVRLIRKAGCTGDDCYECDPVPAADSYATCGGDVRGITFDSKGNIWAGSWTYDNPAGKPVEGCLVRLCGRIGCKDVNGGTAYSIGDKMQITAAGATQVAIPAYGLIGDIYGNVWSTSHSYDIVGRININDSNGAINTTSTPGGLYGIAIDNEGDIWVGRHGMLNATEIDGADAGGSGIGVIENNCVIAGSGTGLAVDGFNNVWATGYSTNSISVIKGGNCANTYSLTGTTSVCSVCNPVDPSTTCSPLPHGFAVDSNNNGWLVCDTGEIVKYSFNPATDTITEVLRKNLCTEVAGSDCTLGGTKAANQGGDSYGYSDMTGFRTTAKMFNPGFGPDIPVTSTTVSGWEGALTTTLATCTCDYDGIPASGDECRLNSDGTCIVPLSISSTTIGTYTLQNLNISCTETIPDMLGGIVPCGRVANNTATTYDETQPCSLCHIFIILQMISTFVVEMGGIIAVFFLIIGGLIYTTSAGDQGRLETGKKTMMYALYGLAVILLSWLIVTIVLVALGYINPLGGQWNIVNCAVA